MTMENQTIQNLKMHLLLNMLVFLGGYLRLQKFGIESWAHLNVEISGLFPTERRMLWSGFSYLEAGAVSCSQ